MADHPSKRRTHASGIALVTALVMAIALISIVTILSTSVTNELRGGRTVKVRGELVQAADGVSEQARIKLLTDFNTSNMTVGNFLNSLTLDSPNVITGLGAGMQGAWAISKKSSDTDAYGYVDIRATVRRGSEIQTVVRRVSFGEQNVFNLAMLSETTNCIYCHLRVNGDVGTLKHLRPGWGTENIDGCGSGGEEGGSEVRGDIYAASTVTDDCTDLSGSPKVLNGADITKQIYTNYTGTYLPKENKFPPIKRTKAMANATGSVSGGTIMTVSSGSTAISAISDNASSLTGVINGNMILIGTAADPIVLDKDIYVSGDVIIKGVVKGRGAIYAGRNMYVGGNVLAQNPPDAPGTGVCIGKTDPNVCAKANIAAGKDELRLAARGNIIVGDYTERNSSNVLKNIDQLQSSEFYRSQFGFWSGTRYYDKTTGDELTKDTATGKYYNVEGTEVSSGSVLSKTADRGSSTSSYNQSSDAYSYSFRPGSIDSSTGNFKNWMSDDFYRTNILGSQNYTFNSWRTDFGSDNATTIKNKLVAAGIPSTTATTIANNVVSGNGGEGNFSSNTGYYRIDGTTVRVIFDSSRSYETQVTQIDGFMYSNLRIAGKTSMQALGISGGMISKEIGILAPGRHKAWWMNNSRYDFLNDSVKCSSSSRTTINTAYLVRTAEDCALTVNYDHRLRNGGYGFNLVEGNPGQTMSWRLSDSQSEKVTW